MIFPYLVILKRDSERTLDFISILVCAFSALSFFFFAFSALYMEGGVHRLFYLLCGVATLLVIGLIVNVVLRRKQQVRYKYWLLVAAVGWIGMTTLPWIALFFFVLAFLEHQTKRPLEIGFSGESVVINALVKKSYPWTDFNNVVLKDGLLTLDFKNNRLLQKEIADDEDEEDADEDEFNAYCQGRLREAGVAVDSQMKGQAKGKH